MGTKRRPGAYDCYGKAEDDEPMFVLLARDPLAPRLVEQWAELREATRGPGAKVDEARACAAAMAVWAAEDRRGEAASGTGGRDNEGGATSVVEAPSAVPDPPIADGCEGDGSCQTCRGYGFVEADYDGREHRCPNCRGSGLAEDQWYW